MSELVLIVEDEARIAEIHRDYLTQSGYESHIIADGGAVVGWVRDNHPALVLLDLMLPGKNGLDICKELRAFSAVPIIMVTARVEEIDRLLGLELGADDYICKPFSPREVVARVKSVLRRSTRPNAVVEKFLSIDEDKMEVMLNGHKIDLTAVEFKLLQILSAKPGRIHSRDSLMERIYTDQRIVCDRTIDSHIKKLRRKLSVVADGVELIHSIYGVGYKFDAT